MNSNKKLKQDYRFNGFDHIVWYVGNAKITSEYYVSNFGFKKIAFKGLETGDRNFSTQVIRNGDITFVFISPYTGDEKILTDYHDNIHEHLRIHGDGVKDVAFTVNDCKKLFKESISKGAKAIREPFEIHDDKNGKIIIATISTYGDTVHSFVERKNYTGLFCPGFMINLEMNNKPNVNLPIPNLLLIDHVVGNQKDGEMLKACSWYEDKLSFHRFWSVDDKDISTEYSSLRSIVMADESLSIKLPINEPAEGKKKSQIQEFVDYYNGPGVQHIALSTNDCVEAVTRLKNRGVEFLQIPTKYYDFLKKRLHDSNIQVQQDIERIRELNILVDFDENGYLLQIFTKPILDRPTVFLEIIERKGCTGFGKGNFKALFESIEIDQQKRGNL